VKKVGRESPTPAYQWQVSERPALLQLPPYYKGINRITSYVKINRVGRTGETVHYCFTNFTCEKVPDTACRAEAAVLLPQSAKPLRGFALRCCANVVG
jgi:hypothetical protein